MCVCVCAAYIRRGLMNRGVLEYIIVMVKLYYRLDLRYGYRETHGVYTT